MGKDVICLPAWGVQTLSESAAGFMSTSFSISFFLLLFGDEQMWRKRHLWAVCWYLERQDSQPVTTEDRRRLGVRLTGTWEVGFPGPRSWTPPPCWSPPSPQGTRCCLAAWWMRDSAGRRSLWDHKETQHGWSWTCVAACLQNSQLVSGSKQMMLP